MSDFIGESLTCLRGERPVFSGLDFTVASGGALLLTGANGSGKSSLLRLMAGLLRPAGGRLWWDREDLLADPDAHRTRLAYLGHQDAVKAALTPREDLVFWLRYRAPGLNARDAAARADEALAWAGLAALAELPCRVLSAGQRRRLALARIAFDATAELWLLDEPTTALDANAIGLLSDRLTLHRAGGGMVVAATHQALDLPDAATLDLDVYARRRSDAAKRGLLLDDVA
ncbi:MAG TPA: cytochrome c biogenesis heme-transporting ATPase CcmA [Alphaproteobacteria bacterium]